MAMSQAVNDEVREEFDRLFREHGDRLWRSLLLTTGSPWVASDAVAEAFAQAIRRRGQLRDPLAWIWRAAFRIAAGDLKEQGRTTEMPSGFAYEYEDRESVADLLHALDVLTPHQRAALALHLYAGYSYLEVATILGSTVAAVGVHIHRAKKSLRAILEDNDDD